MWIKLKVVLWKGYRIRRHHIFLTLCVILIPILLFGLLGFVRSKVSSIGKHKIDEATYNNILYDQIYNRIDVSETKLYYSPDNKFTEALIREVQLKLHIINEGVKGFINEESLLHYYNKHGGNGTTLAVIFKDLENGNIPKILNYDLRNYEQFVDWQTGDLFDSSLQYTPGLGSEKYMEKHFIPLQLALDTCYINMRLGKDEFPVTVALQEFPYPPHLEDLGVNDVFMHMLPFITLFSFVLTCPSILKRVVEEKASGIKELMKVMGVPSHIIWIGWFIDAILLNTISIIFIVFFMKWNWGGEFPAIEYCHPTVLFVFIWAYCSSCISQCFVISTFFNNANFTTIFGILFWIISYLIPYGVGDQLKTFPWLIKMLLCLCPNVAMYFGYTAISVYEIRELGSNWDNLHISASGSANDITLLNVLIILIIDTILYMFLTFYLDSLWPGEYGLPKPWYYLFQSFCDKLKRIKSEVSQSPTPMDVNYKIEASNNKADIKIRNLFKYYDHKTAVNGLNIDFYQGEITALLGHNGAGKTTTMSILTGMIAASKGNVYVCDYDIKQHIDLVRSMIGICPQHNLVFPDLTVQEQLIFFAKLKNSSKAEGNVKELLNRLHLYDKRNCFPTELSGGMKRKLCLGMALVSDPTLLILDEPTSGLDPQARREIWDILLGWRKEGLTGGKKRTVIISTHFMEEADVLGDRIAIMDHGNLVCYGTPMYLKKEYDTGYMLTIIKDLNLPSISERNDESVDEVDAIGYKKMEKITPIPDTDINLIITNTLPGASVKNSTANAISYTLPINRKDSFSTVLRSLEKRKKELGIESINMSVTTLEEVFFKAGNMVENDSKVVKNMPEFNESTIYNQEDQDEPDGCCACDFKNCKTLLRKRGILFWENWSFYLLHFLIALGIVAITIFCGLTNEVSYTKSRPELSIELSKYGDTKVYYSADNNNELIAKMSNFYQQIVTSQKGKAFKVPHVSEEIIKQGTDNIANYRQNMVVAAEFNYSTNDGIVVNAMYSNSALHGAPISVNMLMNSILKAFVGDDSSIVTKNVPLPVVKDDATAQFMSETKVILMWLMMLPMAPMFIMGCFLLYPNVERVSNFKHIQYMCGVKGICYWFMSFCFDLVFYVFAIILFMILFFIVMTMDSGSPIQSWAEIVAPFLIFLLHGIVAIPYTYLFHYKATAQSGFSLLLMINLFTGVVCTVVVFILLLSGDEYWENIGYNLHYTFFIFPQYWLTYQLVQFARKAVTKYNFDHMLPAKMDILCRHEPNPCCLSAFNKTECDLHESYFVKDFTPTASLSYTAIAFIVYSLILLLLENQRLRNIIERLKLFIIGYKPRTYRKLDQVTVDEAVNGQNTAFNADSLIKSFSNRDVVKDISFTVKQGDCFGLLGVNGAGKTTTFRMLTGDEIMTSGNASINQKNENNENKKNTLKDNRDVYLKMLGYCPQFDAINAMLTGRQMLTLFVDLRRPNLLNKNAEVDKWIEKLGLENYADIKCGAYSGGNKRKLSLGISMIANRKVVMLDEPTSGVDPISRRKLWNILSDAKKDNRSIILTSHSMDECESLCDNLAIMKDGEIKHMNTVPRLKQMLGKGYSILIKIKPILVEVIDDSDSAPMIENGTELDSNASVKMNFCKDFKLLNPQLKDEHSTLLHYHLEETSPLSHIFEKLELFVEQNITVEDYTISMATLEDVFLTIARSATEKKDKMENRWSNLFKSTNYD